MNTYSITIREILERNVTINADDYYEAEDKVREMYNNQEIILNADDLTDTVIESNVEANIVYNMFNK